MVLLCINKALLVNRGKKAKFLVNQNFSHKLKNWICRKKLKQKTNYKVATRERTNFEFLSV